MFKRIVFNQFYDLSRQGKDPMKARVNSVLLLSVLLILPLLILFFFYIDVCVTTFGLFSGMSLGGRPVGNVLGLVLLCAVFGCLYAVMGNKARFGRYWNEFQELGNDEKRMESRKGMYYFMVPFFLMLALILYLAFKGE